MIYFSRIVFNSPHISVYSTYKFIWENINEVCVQGSREKLEWF